MIVTVALPLFLDVSARREPSFWDKAPNPEGFVFPNLQVSKGSLPKVVAPLDPRVLVVRYDVASPCYMRLVLAGGFAQVAVGRDLWFDAVNPFIGPQPCCSYCEEEAAGDGVAR